jgi:GNAT superfamily N-acetyltransferase
MSESAAIDAIGQFSICLDVVIRPAEETDLPALEWFGLFAGHRGLIRRVFEQHQHGAAIMLVAQVNHEPSGQLWVDLAQRVDTGVIWAVRVLPCLQRRGLGTRLLDAAEAMLLERGIAQAELTVEIDNPRARHLYERLGYRFAGTTFAVDPPDATNRAGRTQWRLVKTLRQDPAEVARERGRSDCAGRSAT